MSFEIRRVDKRDLPRIEAIYRQAVGSGPPELALDDAIRLSDGPIGWVVIAAPGVVGYVIGQVRSWEFGSAPAGWITGVGVDFDYRRTGVGRALLRALLGEFKAQGVTNVRTMVRREDVPVLRFFRDAGFRTGPYTELELGE